MKTRLFLFFCILLFRCNSATTRADNRSPTLTGQKDNTSSTKVTTEKTSSAQVSQHHLQDTAVLVGDFVLFLRPDSTRFEDYANEDENIYEADSDFGFGISATMDSISRNKKYNNIHSAVSDKRYIVIIDCKKCPQIVDRDTIDYGLVLTSKGKEIRIQTNLHSGNYLQDVDEYFGVNGQKEANNKTSR
jgi:hypothetical protein